MLPVSHDRPDAPPVLIDDRSLAPAFPQMNDSRINHILPDIAIHIVNHSVRQMHNSSARMFLYNMLSYNNWLNEHFDNVFMLSVDHLVLTMQTSTAPAEALFKSSVEQVLMMYCSQLVLEYPDLQGYISPQQLKACKENAGYLYNFKQEISKMSGYQQHPHHHVQAGYGQPTMYGHQPQQVPMQAIIAIDPATGAQVQVLVPATGAGPGMGAGPMMRTGAYVHPNAPAPSRVTPGFQGYGNTRPPDMAPRNRSARNYGSSGAQQSNSGPRSLGDNFEYESDIRQGQMTDLKPGGYIGKHRHQPVEERYEPEVLLPVRETYDTHSTASSQGDTIVDRSKHELGVNTGVVTMAEQAHVDKVEKMMDSNEPTVIAQVAADTNLQDIISQLRADHIKTSEKAIVRQYFLIPDLLVSTYNVQRQISGWINSGNTLTVVALNLQAAFNTASGQKDSDGIYALLSLIREFDRLLTEKVNYFLKQKLEASFDIDSFRTDYPDLPQYVMKKLGRTGADMLQRFEQSILKSFTNEEIGKALNGNAFINIEAGVHDGVHAGCFPNLYSVTLLPLDREMLGLPTKAEKLLLTFKNKYIFNAMKGVFVQNDPNIPFEGVEASHHILVTQDGVAYRVTKALARDEMYITRV